MRVTRVVSELLRLPLSRPRASPSEAEAGRLNHIVVLLVHVHSDAGLTGLGFAYTLQGSLPTYTIHELNLANLTDSVTPVVVSASHKLIGSASYTFNATYERQRPALLESGGNIYAGLGGCSHVCSAHFKTEDENRRIFEGHIGAAVRDAVQASP